MDDVLIPNVEDLISEKPAVVSSLVLPCSLKNGTRVIVRKGAYERGMCLLHYLLTKKIVAKGESLCREHIY